MQNSRKKNNHIAAVSAAMLVGLLFAGSMPNAQSCKCKWLRTYYQRAGGFYYPCGSEKHEIITGAAYYHRDERRSRGLAATASELPTTEVVGI